VQALHSHSHSHSHSHFLATAAAVLFAAIALSACGGGHPGSSRSDSTRSLQARASFDFDSAGWKTDFSKHSAPLSQFHSGGPPRDGIAPIDHPKPISIAKARADRFDEREPVIVVRSGRSVRAYPEEILVWHEIVNDQLGGRPIAVTYCPLCNSALVYDRRVAGRTLTFGTTGNLRNSDLVMWDRQTQSWWQQIGGEAVVGGLTGTRLRVIDAQVLSWSDFKRRYPNGDVLSIDTGFDRPYGDNPYVDYETTKEPPIFYKGRSDRRLPAKERVVAATVGKSTVVFPFSALRMEPVASANVGGEPVVVFYKPGVRSALDARAIAESKDVGTAGAFERRVAGRTLDFRRRGADFADRQTRSIWDITGRAVAGPLRGRQLRRVSHDEQFWFALAAFVPAAKVFRSQ
jgi:Protein of unknown function (DUF3179)